jgi:hypothetical protein
MTFPIYGKIKNVPNHQSDKIYMAYVYYCYGMEYPQNIWPYMVENPF